MNAIPMPFIESLIAPTGLVIRPGHPSTYEALDRAARALHPTSYLEIGVHDGASMLATLSAAPITRLVLCDLWPGRTHAHINRVLEYLNYRGSVRFLSGDSRVLIPRLPVTEPFDMILVDGDHSIEMALTDVRNTVPLLRVGGYLVLDDSSRPELAPACELLVNCFHMRQLFTLSDELDAVTVYEKTEAV